MDVLKRVGRYAGGAVALGGLAFAAAFVGRRTADPMAASYVQPFTIWTQLLGIGAGLVLLFVGLAIVGAAGPGADE
ncbi:hypothetical protein [Haloarchaeobius amylolyticus]|uniref:hypothetical protein n=1 Tax=Haloarchaeobius amylolyticus TaxID=1198296 RepID=UPI00226E1839|nr:hypothetical protein [Haloarchaeobius amylolyticus]